MQKTMERLIPAFALGCALFLGAACAPAAWAEEAPQAEPAPAAAQAPATSDETPAAQEAAPEAGPADPQPAPGATEGQPSEEPAAPDPAPVAAGSEGNEPDPRPEELPETAEPAAPAEAPAEPEATAEPANEPAAEPAAEPDAPAQPAAEPAGEPATDPAAGTAAEPAPAATPAPVTVKPAAKPAAKAAPKAKAATAAKPTAPAKRAAAATTTAKAKTATEPAYAKVAAVKLNRSAVKIKNDGIFRFTAKLIADRAGKAFKNSKITWKISNPKIASITANGLVKGKKDGTVTVFAIAANGVKATARVNVSIDKRMMAKKIPVLTYHRICKDYAKRRFYNNTNLAMAESLFKKQMKWLKQHGYRTVSTQEFLDWRVNGTFLPKKSVLITIDDGFYETYHVAYPILKKYNLKATSFVIGKNIKKTTSAYNPKKKRNRYVGLDVIEKVRKEYPNLEFQSHTYNMHKRGKGGNGRATFWSSSAIQADFAKNDQYGFTAIAWPFGHTSKKAFAAAKADKGIKICFGYMMDWAATRKSSLYNIPRFKMFGDRGLGDFTRVVRKAR